MIGWLLTMAALGSDPVALRQPLTSGGYSAALLGQTVSVSVRGNRGPMLGLVGRPQAHVGVAVGEWTPWIGADRAWGVDLYGSGGLDVLWASPGVAVSVTGSALAGIRGQGASWMTGLVIPAGVRLDRPEASLPVLLETRAGVRGGPVWLGVLGQAGAVFATGGPPAMHLKGGLSLRVSPR